MPRHAAAYQHLMDQMPETRSVVASAVDVLASQGVQQQQVAHAAGWAAPYLSQFLTRGQGEKGERVPGKKKLGDLVVALNMLLTIHSPRSREQLARLAEVAERYEVRVTPMSAPTNAVESTAPNFADRPELTAFIENYASRPGLYAFDGGLMAGLSTALLQAERALERQHFEVCSVNVEDEIVVPGLIQASNTGIVGALAARMQSHADDTVLGLDFYAVQETIRDHLRGFPNGVALLLDNIDGLDQASKIALNSMLKNWKNLRARHEEGFVRLTVWTAFTSNVESAQERSWLHAEDAKVVSWFSKDEVHRLAGTLSQLASASNAPSSWTQDVIDIAWDRFGGQPYLTHQFLWARAHDGGTAFSEDEAISALYVSHLDRVSRTLTSLMGDEDLAREAVDLLEGGEDLPPLYADLLHKRVFTSLDERRVYPKYYRDYLRARLEYRLRANERKRERATR